MTEDQQAATHVRELLKYIGEDPDRGGLVETPSRYAKALREMTSGARTDPRQLLKTFDDGAEGYDQMVIVSGAHFYSLCEHHLVPFFGQATIAYIPTGKVVGLSKLVRVLEAYSKRLQVQERMTNQIADLLQSELAPAGVGVFVRARHLCMEARGIKSHGAETTTTALRGCLLNETAARAEFMRGCRNG